MAILSAQLMLSDKQAITATAVSTNVIDFGKPGTWIHASVPLVNDKGVSGIPLQLQVVEDFNNLTSLTFAVRFSDAEDGSGAEVVYTEIVELVNLKAGRKSFVRTIPYGSDKRFMSIQYIVLGSNPTSGVITASIGSPLESTAGAR